MAGSQWPSVLCHIDPCHVVAPQVIALDPSDKFAAFIPSTWVRVVKELHCVCSNTSDPREIQVNLSLNQNYNMQSSGLHGQDKAAF